MPEGCLVGEARATQGASQALDQDKGVLWGLLLITILLAR